MKKEELFFTTRVQQNCRKFYKRIYDFHVKIDMEFIDSLSCYGVLTLKEFSKIIPSANDVFIIKGKNNLEISGALNDSSLLLVVRKEDDSVINEVEKTLCNFLKS